MGYKRTGRPTGRPSKHTAEDWARAKLLLEDGTSYRETSITTGIPKTTLIENLPGFGWTPSESGSFRTLLNKHSQLTPEVWGMNRHNDG